MGLHLKPRSVRGFNQEMLTELACQDDKTPLVYLTDLAIHLDDFPKFIRGTSPTPDPDHSVCIKRRSNTQTMSLFPQG